MSRRRFLPRLVKFLAICGFFVAMAGGGTMTYFHYAPPSQTCLSCHEMQTHHDQWAASAHKDVHCRECHGGSLTLNIHAVKEHANRVIGHFSIKSTDELRLSHDQVLRVSQSCAACHATETAKWKAGHSATFARIFLDEKQNKSEQLNGDCLRCHGMFYEGTTETLVSPISTTGPWKLLEPDLEKTPTMPCLACHQVHVSKAQGGLALYSRREKARFDAAALPLPKMNLGGKPVKASPDPRQRLCVQCHAPNAFHTAMTQDDHTPLGKHEGLSCVACHDAHSGQTAASCATCHTEPIKPGYKVHQKPATSLTRR